MIQFHSINKIFVTFLFIVCISLFGHIIFTLFNNYTFTFSLSCKINAQTLNHSSNTITNNKFNKISNQHLQNLPPLEITDLDGDGLVDVRLETPQRRILLSSKTGSISLYYLKGKNYEENLIPTILNDLGFIVPATGTSYFESIIGTQSLHTQPFTWKVEAKSAQQLVLSATAHVTLQNGTLLSLVRKFIIPYEGYTFELEQSLTNLSNQPVVLGSSHNKGFGIQFGPGLFLEPFKNNSLLAYNSNTDIEKYDSYTKFTSQTADKKYVGFGIKTNYFCLLIDSSKENYITASEIQIKPTSQQYKYLGTLLGYIISINSNQMILEPSKTETCKYSIYLGPKSLDDLKAIGKENVTDYGFLSTVLLRLLQFFHKLYPNFGIAIILLTLFIRVLLHPLTIKQTKSMAKMQKIQPMIQDLKDRYRDNPQKFNEEVLKLYQKYNVNPFGGCLPILLQLPILFALYNTINIAVELRKVPFLWIPDLSKADPLLILPIGIAVLMYYQQGQIQDQQQQQMLAFMPMLMFIITWSLPAGLLIYWFTSSVLGVIQQKQANKIMAKIKEEKL